MKGRGRLTYPELEVTKMELKFDSQKFNVIVSLTHKFPSF